MQIIEIHLKLFQKQCNNFIERFLVYKKGKAPERGGGGGGGIKRI